MSEDMCVCVCVRVCARVHVCELEKEKLITWNGLIDLLTDRFHVLTVRLHFLSQKLQPAVVWG